ncbi:MAG: VPLPA-CTERM sorting domain-containing protein [Methylococcaceae bacterium]
MVKKIRHTFVILMLSASSIFFYSHNVSAAYLPNDIGQITDYLDDSGYFNGYTELDSIDFSGQWRYTAVAYESGNENTVSEIANGEFKFWKWTFSTPWNPDDASFSTFHDENFGEWQDVDFSTEQLFFEDRHPTNIQLDPFSSENSAYFRVFQLNDDSELLDYLGDNAITLTAGTIIVGFNDNGLSLGDADYDDMIVALQPVPIPAGFWLFSSGLLGMIGFRRG